MAYNYDDHCKRAFDLTEKDLPLTVDPWNTGEGMKGFKIHTKDDKEVDFEKASYGYEANFRTKENAIKMRDMLLKAIKASTVIVGVILLYLIQ